jgi:hypothetical protein
MVFKYCLYFFKTLFRFFGCAKNIFILFPLIFLKTANADTVHLGLKIHYQTAMSHVEKKDLPVIEMLRRIAIILPDSKFLIAGHTDNVGTYDINYDLSKGRASIVKRLMLNSDISPDRIETKWFSYDAPIASNDTPEGRSKNRRTVATVYGLTSIQAAKLVRAAEKSKRFYVITLESEKVSDYINNILEPKIVVSSEPKDPEAVVEENVIVEAEQKAEAEQEKLQQIENENTKVIENNIENQFDKKAITTVDTTIVVEAEKEKVSERLNKVEGNSIFEIKNRVEPKIEAETEHKSKSLPVENSIKIPEVSEQVESPIGTKSEIINSPNAEENIIEPSTQPKFIPKKASLTKEALKSEPNKDKKTKKTETKKNKVRKARKKRVSLNRHRYYAGWDLTDNELVASRTGFTAIWVTDFNQSFSVGYQYKISKKYWLGGSGNYSLQNYRLENNPIFNWDGITPNLMKLSLNLDYQRNTKWNFGFDINYSEENFVISNGLNIALNKVGMYGISGRGNYKFYDSKRFSSRLNLKLEYPITGSDPIEPKGGLGFILGSDVTVKNIFKKYEVNLGVFYGIRNFENIQNKQVENLVGFDIKIRNKLWP